MTIDMVLALLTSALISIICFISTFVMGFTMAARTGLSQHVLLGLFTTFLVTLTQSMTMFYFIGTGKQVKDLVAALPQGGDLVQRTKVFKAKVFPPALWAMLFTMATMIIGGGVHTRVSWTPPILHGALAAVSLYFNLVAFWKEGKYMIENNMLMEEVDRTMLHMKDDAANFPDPNDRATQESEFGLELRTRDREKSRMISSGGPLRLALKAE